MEFRDRIVLVTGAASGIGRASALRFAAAGATVVAVDRDAAGAAQTASLSGGEAMAADVTDGAAVEAFVQDILGRHGRIDAFHCNAGVQGGFAPITAYDSEEFDRVVAVNLKGVFLGLRHVLPAMIARGEGAVVVTCSIASLGGLPNLSGYVASKHAALGLTRSAAIDVAHFGVRVNAVCPGAIDTPMLAGITRAINPADPAAAIARFAASVPNGRLIEPSEVAEMVAYLCSDRARSITGAHFVIDGGRSTMMGGATRAA